MFLQSKYLIKRLVYIFIALLIIPAQSTETDLECGLVHTNDPPFWIIVGESGMKNHEYENLKGPQTFNGNFAKVLNNNTKTAAVNSIAVQDPDRPIIYQSKAINSNRFLPVIIVRTPDQKIDESKTAIATKYNKHSDFLINNGRVYTQGKRSSDSSRNIAENGDRGYIFGGSLRKVNGEEVIVNPSIIPPGTLKDRIINGKTDDDFIFVVDNESPFFSIPGVENLDDSYTLTLKTDGEGKYIAFKPCPDPENPDKDLRPSYFFDLKQVDIDGKTVNWEQTIEFKPQDECDQLSLSALVPLEEYLYLPLLSLTKSYLNQEDEPKTIADIVYFNGLRLAQLPQSEPFEVGNNEGCYTRGPHNSVHYTGYDDCDNPNLRIEQQSDSLLEYNAACSLTGALKIFQDKCPGCIPQWGDAFMPKGVHSSHRTGHCIDFRPVLDAGEDGIGPSTYYSRKRKTYNFDNTVKLAEAMMEAGADQIIFNDFSVRGQIDKNIRNFTRYNTDNELNIKDNNGGPVHDNHLHICFPTQKELRSGDNKKFRAEQKKRMEASCRYSRENK